MTLTVDVFLFNDEFDILACRLHELRGVVDRFIAIEGDMTMAGEPKPYRLTRHYEGLWADVEIITVPLGDLRGVPPQRQAWVRPGYEDHWKRDWKQRDAAHKVLSELDAHDIVLLGDVDEIPRREAVETVGQKSRLMMRPLIYSTKWSTGRDDWTGTVIGRAADMQSFPKTHRARNSYPMIRDAGWHMTWFGGEEAVVKKATMFAHGEMAEDIEKVRQCWRDHIRPGDGSRLAPYTGDLPGWVEEGLAPPSWTET